MGIGRLRDLVGVLIVFIIVGVYFMEILYFLSIIGFVLLFGVIGYIYLIIFDICR